MLKLVVVAHGQFATGIHSSLELIAGQQEQVEAINFSEGMSAQALKEKIRAAVTDSSETLILTDLLGGTPFKVSMELLSEQEDSSVVVLTGLNLAMLIEATFYRDMESLENLAARLVRTAKEGVVDSLTLLEQEVAEEIVFDDGI